MGSKLAFAEGPKPKEVLLKKWDEDNSDKKRVAWKITEVTDMTYAVIEYIIK